MVPAPSPELPTAWTQGEAARADGEAVDRDEPGDRSGRSGDGSDGPRPRRNGGTAHPLFQMARYLSPAAHPQPKTALSPFTAMRAPFSSAAGLYRMARAPSPTPRPQFPTTRGNSPTPCGLSEAAHPHLGSPRGPLGPEALPLSRLPDPGSPRARRRLRVLPPPPRSSGTTQVPRRPCRVKHEQRRATAPLRRGLNEPGIALERPAAQPRTPCCSGLGWSGSVVGERVYQRGPQPSPHTSRSATGSSRSSSARRCFASASLKVPLSRSFQIIRRSSDRCITRTVVAKVWCSGLPA